MSTMTTSYPRGSAAWFRWPGWTMPDALRALWDAASASPEGGLDRAGVTRALAGYGRGGADHALRRALARGHLIRVSRLTIDGAGRIHQEWRYHATGGRP